jgi:ATP-dependent Clp protease ATP-binding subunit ClpX
MKRAAPNDSLRCSFCHKAQEAVVKLISSPSDNPRAYICDECVAVCNSIMEDDRPGNHSPWNTPGGDFDLPALLKHANSLVLGQDKALRHLGQIVYSYLRRNDLRKSMKANVLLVGPTGCGKTLALRIFSEAVGLPLAEVDATGLFASGCLNDNPLARLVSKADRQTPSTPGGIVCIENIDRIGDPDGGNREGRWVQQSLLTALDGAQVNVEARIVDTTGILFVGCGTFGIAAPNRQPVSRPGIGKPEDLIPLGFLPEFASRFLHVIQFESLDEARLLGILKAGNSEMVRRYENLFAHGRVQVQFSEEAIGNVAREAASRAGGARSLAAVLEAVSLHAAMRCGDRDDLETLVIDGNFVQEALVQEALA